MKLASLFKTAAVLTAGLVLPGAANIRAAGQAASLQGAPSLQKQGDAVQMVVDGKPFLMLGGELLNSSSSSLDYMTKIWPHMNDLHANTVVTPVSWEQIEPKEGRVRFLAHRRLDFGGEGA